MKDRFLNLVTVTNRSDPDSLHYLSGYYKSTDLRDTIASLLRSSIDARQIENKKVLLKPNWVKHSIAAKDEVCLRTNDYFTIAVLTAVLEMKPLEVVIGDAPIQGGIWDRIIAREFRDEIIKLSNWYAVPINIKDFRRRTYSISENKPLSEIRPLDQYTIFDLGEDSLLEPITKPGRSRFRVTNYNPDRMSLAHAPGTHKYCIAKDLFDADIVFSIPKIKTHQKTGITGALKNIVGVNGDKDFLPHHRMGGTVHGGDCYPGSSVLRYWSEIMLDKANQKQGSSDFWLWQKFSSILWRISLPGPEHNIDAGWYGNDTTWRMVMDLNKIATYGRIDGTLSAKPQRQIFSICDGIIGGQGDGPLNPDPLPLGIVSATNDSLTNDIAMAILMNLSPIKIPLLNFNNSPLDCDIRLNSNKINLAELKQLSINTRPPKGWIRHFEAEQ